MESPAESRKTSWSRWGFCGSFQVCKRVEFWPAGLSLVECAMGSGPFHRIFSGAEYLYWLGVPRYQFRDKLRVLRRGEALFETRVSARTIEIPQSLGVEPETGEASGAENSVGAEFYRLEPGLNPFETGNLLPQRQRDQVLANTCQLIESFLRAEVARAAGHGHFNDQFGSAGRVQSLDSGLAAVLGEYK